jgi:hypothetical protein
MNNNIKKTNTDFEVEYPKPLSKECLCEKGFHHDFCPVHPKDWGELATQLEGKESAEDIFNKITSNGMREMTHERFTQAMEEYANQFRTQLTDEELKAESEREYPEPIREECETWEIFMLCKHECYLQRNAHIKARKMGTGVDFNFVKWYSGMSEEKIKAAHKRYLNEQTPKPQTNE